MTKNVAKTTFTTVYFVQKSCSTKTWRIKFKFLAQLGNGFKIKQFSIMIKGDENQRSFNICECQIPVPKWIPHLETVKFLGVYLLLPLADIGTDIYTGTSLILQGHIWWGSATLLMVFWLSILNTVAAAIVLPFCLSSAKARQLASKGLSGALATFPGYAIV